MSAAESTRHFARLMLRLHELATERWRPSASHPGHIGISILPAEPGGSHSILIEWNGHSYRDAMSASDPDLWVCVESISQKLKSKETRG